MLRACVAVVAALLCGLAWAQYPYDINAFTVTASLRQDSSLYVNEQIDVTFNEGRHGIYRKIPYMFDTAKGLQRKTMIDQIAVSDPSGQPYTTKISKEGAYIKIRIGDKDVTLPPGTNKVYSISYRVQNVVNWFGDAGWGPYSELYWNLTGNQWDTPIRSFSYRVAFPETQKAQARIFAGYTGSPLSNSLFALGSSPADDQSLTSITLTATDVSGERRDPLSPGEGATIVLSLPEGVITKPSEFQKAWWGFVANSGFALPILVLLILFPIWLAIGRDPKGKPYEVLFEPPDGLSASEAGCLLDQNVDMRDISAGLITLAVKGYLVIDAKEPGLFGRRDATITMTGKQRTPDLGPFESALLTRLGTSQAPLDKADLTSKVGTHITELRQKLYRAMVDRGYYRYAPDSASVVGCLGGLFLVAFFCFVLWSVFSLGADALSYIIGGVVSLAMIVVFAIVIPRRTPRGADVRNQVAAFENAMRGRKNYMEWVADKKIAEAKFEEYLPYAIAFGLVKQWSDTFREVVTHSPAWYRTPSGYYHSWSMVNFADDFDSVTNAVGYAANTPPRTSSSSGSSGFSSGGGFSGGGFGGGGGGSW